MVDGFEKVHTAMSFMVVEAFLSTGHSISEQRLWICNREAVMHGCKFPNSAASSLQACAILAAEDGGHAPPKDRAVHFRQNVLLFAKSSQIIADTAPGGFSLPALYVVLDSRCPVLSPEVRIHAFSKSQLYCYSRLPLCDFRGPTESCAVAGALLLISKLACGWPADWRCRYSCPEEGCKRNKSHRKFVALKTQLCVKNHYKRSHCQKMLTCAKCRLKKFAVVADLKTHEKHCGSDKWQCSCGTTFRSILRRQYVLFQVPGEMLTE